MPPPPKIFENFIQKMMHFGAEFSLVLRCILSTGGRRLPLNPSLDLEPSNGESER